MMKNKFYYLLFTLFTAMILSSCEDDSDPVLPTTPIIENVEIGSGNNKRAVIGRDFHLDFDILAGDKIDIVQVRIEPIAGETSTSTWNFELTWEEFKGVKNTNVHKHFDIPEDAIEGKYNFIILVNDQNGTSVEESYEIDMIDAANLEVDPELYIWQLYTDQGDSHYVNGTLENPENVEFSKDEVLTSYASIRKVKGDGKMYLLLIKKKANHLPESVDAIDFSKVIVYDVFEHENEVGVYTFGNLVFDGMGGYLRSMPPLTIGATADNNLPDSNSISGEKAWESGEYYFGLVYTNSSYNISVFHYFEVNVVGF